MQENELEIHGKTGPAAALMATDSDFASTTDVNPRAEVFTSAVGWLQLQDSNLGPGG